SGLSQAKFAALLGVSVRTLQDWEQGRREPNAAAKTLIKVAELHPAILRKIAA
ncbi:MAG TPA: helix-turn-helix domain-containing protein, partial [Candidatus Binatia bacterium]|nr:helix-turn-helix domain-containing protein [Candidatus Binatia bacterium]